MEKRPLVTVMCLLLVQACASSQVSVLQRSARSSQPLKNVALAPGAGVLAEAIGLELFNAGFTIIDANQAIQILGRAGLTEMELTSSQGFSALHEKGIEAVLVAKSVEGHDGQPQSASVRITSTRDGQTLAGLTWQNGWGGVRGSPADRTMRKDLTEAAREIASELLKQIRVVR
jgi:hypothetical protein